MKTGHIIELPKCRIRKQNVGLFGPYEGDAWNIELPTPEGERYFVAHLALPLHADAVKLAHRIAKGHQTRLLKKAQTELDKLTGGTP